MHCDSLKLMVRTHQGHTEVDLVIHYWICRLCCSSSEAMPPCYGATGAGLEEVWGRERAGGGWVSAAKAYARSYPPLFHLPHPSLSSNLHQLHSWCGSEIYRWPENLPKAINVITSCSPGQHVSIVGV